MNETFFWIFSAITVISILFWFFSSSKNSFYRAVFGVFAGISGLLVLSNSVLIGVMISVLLILFVVMYRFGIYEKQDVPAKNFIFESKLKSVQIIFISIFGAFTASILSAAKWVNFEFNQSVNFDLIFNKYFVIIISSALVFSVIMRISAEFINSNNAK